MLLYSQSIAIVASPVFRSGYKLQIVLIENSSQIKTRSHPIKEKKALHAITGMRGDYKSYC